MKNKLIVVLLTVLLILPAGVSADMSAVYNSSDDTIALTGSLGSGVESVSFHIAAVNADNTVSAGNLPLISDLIMTADDGSVSHSVSNNLAPGRYNVFFGYDGSVADYQRIVIFDASSPSTAAMLARVNAATGENDARSIASDSSGMLSLGIDTETDTLAAQALAICINIRQGSGYTIESFRDAYNYANAVAAVLSGSSVDSVMKTSAYAFDCTYSEYLAAKANDDIDAFILTGGCARERMTLDDIVILTKIYSAATRGDVQDAVEKNAAALGVNISAGSTFQSIPAQNRYLLWEYLKNNALSVTTKATFRQLFNSYASTLVAGNDIGGGQYVSGSSPASGGSAPSLPSTSISGNADMTEQSMFNDISGHFAEENIKYLAEKNIISGYPGGSFMPYGNITRAELCKIIAAAFAISGTADVDFEDVSKGAWYNSYVSALASNGIVTGFDGRFNPDSYVTREDTAVMLMRTLASKGASLGGAYSFADASSISSYAQTAVEAFAANGYLKGDGTNFYPKNNITRGEAAELLGRIYRVYGGE